MFSCMEVAAVMPSVELEQTLEKDKEMATLSSTIEMFDTFKQNDDEKESDEESFHLPLLDDEQSKSPKELNHAIENDTLINQENSNTKPNDNIITEAALNSDEEHKDKKSEDVKENGETEDDILNKFDLAAPTSSEAIDPILEDALLEDSDAGDDKTKSCNDVDDSKEDLNNKTDNCAADLKIGNCNDKLANDNEFKDKEEAESMISETKVTNGDCTVADDSEDKEEVLINDEQISSDDSVDAYKKCDDFENITADNEKLENNESDKNFKQSLKEDNIEEQTTGAEKEIEAQNATEAENVTEAENATKAEKAIEAENVTQAENVAEPANVTEAENVIEAENAEKETEQETLSESNNINQAESTKKVDERDNTVLEKDVNLEKQEPVHVELETEKDSNLLKESAEGNGDTEKSIGPDLSNPMEVDDPSENDPKSGAAVDMEVCDTQSGKRSVQMEDKCDNSNDSSQNSESEDLLAISMIKDADQDNADIQKDAEILAKEKEEDDKNSQECNSTDTENDTENDKVECNGTDNFDDVEDSMEPESEVNEQNETLVNGVCDDKDVGSEVLSEVDELSQEKADATAQIGTNDDNETQGKGVKRTVAESDQETPTKKLKLSEGVKETEESTVKQSTELKSLLCFSQFMKNLSLDVFSRSDLEEFCIQKICEVLMHKSQVGDLNQKLRTQEQIIEALRKEQQVVNKQMRDLEIVNRKLMNEIKTYNVTKKPVNPVKITRSVGLQVRMANSAADANTKRRPMSVSPQKTAQNATANRSPRPVAPLNKVNAALSPQKRPQQAGTPILSNVLQRRTVVKTTPTRPMPALQSKPVEKKAGGSGFIDLTDEDDKKMAAKTAANTIKTVTTIPQGIRLTTAVKSPLSTVLPGGVNSNSTPQVMYVVQSNTQHLSQGVLTTSTGAQKAVLVNFQPNGVVGQNLTSPAVSVIPKAVTNTIPLKTTPTAVKTTVKHPAPLPNPPTVTVPADKKLKAIPPKPILTIRKTNNGIILQWRMPYDLTVYESIASYQLYAYQETNAPPSTDMWRKVGDVKALALPMACTLTQFADKNKYYFAVRPVDIHKRIGRFSNPEEISL